MYICIYIYTYNMYIYIYMYIHIDNGLPLNYVGWWLVVGYNNWGIRLHKLDNSELWRGISRGVSEDKEENNRMLAWNRDRFHGCLYSPRHKIFSNSFWSVLIHHQISNFLDFSHLSHFVVSNSQQVAAQHVCRFGAAQLHLEKISVANLKASSQLEVRSYKL